jgi:hypothetical protein
LITYPETVVYFDGLLNGIKDLAVAAAGKKRNFNNRSKRTSFDNHFEFPNTCSLTEKELDQINHLLQSFYNEKDNQSTCEVKQAELSVVNTVGTSNRCNQLIESIIGNLKDLKIAFNCLSKQSAAAYNSRYEKLKATYEEEKRKLQQKLDIAQKKFELKFKMEMGNLKKRVQELENILLTTLEELEKERDRHQNTNLKLILESLKNGNMQLAWEVFTNNVMGLDRRNIKTIITDAIATRKIPTKNVIEFTSGLKNDVDAMVSGAVYLFNELEKRKGLDRETARLLQKKIDDIIQHCLDLDGTDSKLNLDRSTIEGFILVYNNICFINKYVHDL